MPRSPLWIAKPAWPQYAARWTSTIIGNGTLLESKRCRMVVPYREDLIASIRVERAKLLSIHPELAGDKTNPVPWARADIVLDAYKLPAPGLLTAATFAGLQGGFFVAIDPASLTCDVLASSRRKEKASPFDDGKSFTIPFLVADPARRRVLFLLLQDQGPGSRSGLWEWSAATKKFTSRLETLGAWAGLRGSSVRAERVLIYTHGLAIDYDLTTNKPTLLWAWDPNVCGPQLVYASALCKEKFPLVPPYAYQDGRLWSGTPLGRVSLKQKTLEVFPLTPTKRQRFLPPETVELIGDAGYRLMCGNFHNLWVFTLRKNK